MDEVKSLGFNAIRLPYSNELVETNPVVTETIKANPALRGKHALDVLDDIVRYAQKIGVKIILDDHRCHASRPHTVNFLDEPLWYTQQYPESSWIADWKFLARRYRANDAVIGFDLRNEPHTDGPGPWSISTYLHQGATWGPYNGIDDPATDWRLAAERGGDAALSVNPHLLMFVEGTQLYPDPAQPDGVDSYWWGSILAGVRTYPVQLNVPNQLVYSPHDWGPWKWNMPWFRNMTYASLQQVWNRNWSYIVDDPSAPHPAPLWIGEFGTTTNNPRAMYQTGSSNQAAWFTYFVQYLHDHSELSWSFFALNGTNSNDHVAGNGLLNAHWNGVSNETLKEMLQSLQ
jgi:endoglucanase